MIIRKKNIKANPSSLLSIQVDIEPNDVARIFRAYLLQLEKQAPDLVREGNLLYDTHDLECIISTHSIVHHFTPSVKRIVFPWLLDVAKRENLINHVDPCIAKYQGHPEGDCYSINEKKLLF